MKRIPYIFSILCLFLVTVLSVLIGCSRDTDEQLFTKMNIGLRVGNFLNQPEAVRSVSELLNRGNPKVNEPKVVDCIINTGAMLLTDNAEWIDRNEARDVYDLLKQYNNETIVSGLVRKVIQYGGTSAPAPAQPKLAIDEPLRKVIQNEASRLHVLFLSVKLGIPGSQERLNKVLDDLGDKAMAEDFLNSGSSELHEGGKQWANNHGYHIMSGMGSHRVSWGNF
jgi:hypothetical protein